MATGRSTIVRPPPEDPNKSPIENVLEVTELGVLGPDIFTNTRQPWHPPGARGIFGGAVIAQCLASAQKTVPNDFFVHSCHCYFLLAGSSEIPILFHVERVRDGRSFATRTVQARQRGRCIFTTTVSFVKEGAGGETQVRHAAPLPAGVRAPPADWRGEPEWSTHSPFQTYRISMVGPDGKPAKTVTKGEGEEPAPHEMKSRNWVRARGKFEYKASWVSK